MASRTARAVVRGPGVKSKASPSCDRAEGRFRDDLEPGNEYDSFLLTTPERAIERWLKTAGPASFTAYATAACFATYFCMYAFRKPFAVGTFEGLVQLPFLPPLGLKTLYIIAQVLGYAAAKFIGIKVVSEMPRERRAHAILALIGAAELALLLFAVVPPPYAAFCLALNGLPLGMIWGLVFGFVEGRKVSELMGAGLCASFIVASGFVKTAGKLVLGWGVSEPWMPFVTGAVFFVPLVISVGLLSQIPPPSAEDEALRTKRAPMDGAARWRFFKRFSPGLLILIVLYMLVTAYRDFRDNFAREIWDALGYADEPAILTTAELPVALGSLVAVAMLMGIKNNRKALLAVHGMMLLGASLFIGVATVLYQRGVLGPAAWMISLGLGLYLGYVPYNCVLFDRMIAALGSVATAGFLIYVADAFGYLGSVGLLLYKNFGHAQLSWLSFFERFSYITAIVTSGLYVLSAIYFMKQSRELSP